VKNEKEFDQKSDLIPLSLFVFIMCVFVLFPGTIHMLKAQVFMGRDHYRYYMYGRYADIVIPFVLIYSFGFLFKYINNKYSAIFVSYVTTLLFSVGFIKLVLPGIGDTRILNMGVAWFSSLYVYVLMFCLLAVLLVRYARFVGVFIVMLISLNIYNTNLVFKKLVKYTNKNISFYEKLSEIKSVGGNVYLNGIHTPVQYYKAKYYLFEDLSQYNEDIVLNPEKDYFLAGNKDKLLSVCDFLKNKEDISVKNVKCSE
jgi:hypothetical protein